MSERYIVGLTGGIGSGKSTIAREFRKHAIDVVDADQGSRVVVEPGTPALDKIAEHFGTEVITPAGSLDRALLRQLVFSDDKARKWLERLLHPLIRQWMIDNFSKAQSPYVILESPVLMETDQHELIDTMLFVDVPEQLQIKRAVKRDGNSPEQIKRIMSAQMPREQKLNLADIVFDNSLPAETIPTRVMELHQQFLQTATEKKSRLQNAV